MSADIRGHEALLHHHLCGRKATLKRKSGDDRSQERCESRGGRPGLPVSNVTYGLYGHLCLLLYYVPRKG